MEKASVQPWRGNLPCCHGSTDGCTLHNQAHVPIFWDASLPSNYSPSSAPGALFKALYKRYASTTASDPSSQAAPPEIWSSLPRDASTCDPLPLVHPAVPYTLSFYHLHALINSTGQGSTHNELLQSLTCSGTNEYGSRPRITWTVTPKIVDGSLLVEHYYTFPISLQRNPKDSNNSWAYTKNWFISQGYRSFAPCTHCTRIFRSIREETNKGGNFVGVEFTLKNVLNQEFRDEWRTEVGRQPVNMSCGMCYTDFSMSFEVVMTSVLVRFWVHKDLGSGQDPSDPKWIAALRGTAITRDRKDFSRMRLAFMAPASGPSRPPDRATVPPTTAQASQGGIGHAASARQGQLSAADHREPLDADGRWAGAGPSAPN